MGITEAIGSGVLAGLALAVPLGAIGVLLLREGSRYGTRRALPAALAVATVDVLYCALAVLLGAAAAPVVSRLEPWPAIVGGLLLVAIGTQGLARVRRVASEGPVEDLGRGVGRFARFFMLTLINPATLVYFTAIIAGLGALTAGPATAAVFVAGVGLSSLAWQALLIAAGGILHGRSSPRGHLVTHVAGSAVVGILGIALIVNAVH
ncbi:LysE family transporter [Nocardioides carbamazepini]|jgi:arginine exporter protein ArgO|uniref:LysE family translocator n=1 Tax=Nocardioides carbamazepini TaxID=2854259 RepID=UPI00214A4E9C|nr:LysE family transporter [Nocardioides carbamazepini]MCR1783375.1 LysE family transporter [Nocardioides carbamazepini]